MIYSLSHSPELGIGLVGEVAAYSAVTVILFYRNFITYFYLHLRPQTLPNLCVFPCNLAHILIHLSLSLSLFAGKSDIDGLHARNT